MVAFGLLVFHGEGTATIVVVDGVFALVFLLELSEVRLGEGMNLFLKERSWM